MLADKFIKVKVEIYHSQTEQDSRVVELKSN